MAIKRRFIAKFQQPAESQPTETKGISPLGMPRRRLLMEMPGQADGGLGAASESVDRWYAVDGLEQRHDSAWDDAHELVHEAGRSRNNEQLLLVEPDIEQVWYPEKPVRPAQFDMGAAQPKACVFQGPDPATPDGATTFAWHLGKKYSRLQEARQQVKEENSRKIRVAHLDTGFDPSHITCPANIDLTRQRNFVTEDGVPNSSGDARDPGNSGYLLNPGHGPATLALLSGNKVPASNNYPGWTEDFLGGAPFASVVPIRIANSVIHFWTSSVAEGIEYAISIKADVLSMSMGGLPSAAWADAVNKAYEAGMVIVCAAGNNYSGFPTREIVWPARFERVIAACGVMSDKRPYYNLPVRTMQGNYGPPGKMVTALSAFTPNTPWARLGCANLVDMNGAGTSSATPQIAATAALWLAQHGEQFQTRDWRRAEAVRQALFESASKPEAIGARHGLAGVTADDTSEMLGRGMLNALAALDKVPADLKRTARDSVDFALLRALPGFGAGPASVSDRLLELELAQLVARSRKLQELVAETYG